MNGIIKWYNHTDGIGFIKGEDSEEYLFLREDLVREDGRNAPRPYCRDEVTFEVGREIRSNIFLATKVRMAGG